MRYIENNVLSVLVDFPKSGDNLFLGAHFSSVKTFPRPGLDRRAEGQKL